MGGERPQTKQKSPSHIPKDFIQASPQMTLLSCTVWEVSLPPPFDGGGGVVGCCHLEISLPCIPRGACPCLLSPCRGEQTRGTKTSTPRCKLVYLPPALASVYLRNLKRTISPHSIECPTSIWLLIAISAMTPPGSSCRLSVCHFHLTKRGGGRAQGISPKGDARSTHYWSLQIRPTRKGTKQQRQGETHQPAPGDSTSLRGPTPRSPRKAPPKPAATPWASSAARPMPSRAPRVPKQLLYLLNLATSGY